jgi:hypothetical protein
MVDNSDAIVRALRAERRAIPFALDAAGVEGVAAIKQVVSAPDFPRSAPGAPPHVQSGEYRNSFQSRVMGGTTLRVGTPEQLGLWLEYGTHTKHGTVKMAARPHFTPFAHTVLPKLVRDNLVKALGAAAKSAG